ncbi:uncharacterized protein LOC130895287 [Diorhabda carinulata]|uniref:uncharacterized protein LOC130895287 n=1 Tax=Diorhabda carinulata TaxID=1163345 RepID=UPI0025A22FF2|nr:uncharacterized protein LOC130895287 [Diorhabda carinulata]
MGDEEIKVCKTEFLYVHSLQKSRVRVERILKMTVEWAMVPEPDRRSKHNNRLNRYSDEQIQSVFMCPGIKNKLSCDETDIKIKAAKESHNTKLENELTTYLSLRQVRANAMQKFFKSEVNKRTKKIVMSSDLQQSGLTKINNWDPIRSITVLAQSIVHHHIRKPVYWDKGLSEQNYVFDFQKEIIAYCIDDVSILARSCLKFRDLLLKEGGVDPFTEAITLPGACNKIFRRNFLKPNTIGLIPKNGYRCRDKQSKIAIQWLIWEERQRGIKIEHASRGREVVINGLKLDGYCNTTREVFEFEGCYFHGCPKCIKYKRGTPTYEDPSLTYEQRYEATSAKNEKLRQLGYEVLVKWECDFRREMSENSEISKYTEKHPLFSQTPLEPRDAFYGGRTDATKLYYSCKEGEKINYRDICSLYPYINKYGKYPIGHPEVYVGEACYALDLKTTNGLIKCKVLPPTNLYHPVLPYKTNNKLIFPLCRTCCENMLKEECSHADEERAITGTWVMDEVTKALEKGYKILDIYEIWEYETVQYDPSTKSGGLFAEYISKFLKIKQQASGWPPECKTDEDKKMYIKEYFDREGVELNPDEIEYNSGRRQVGKSIITSFWGKLGQLENQSKCSIVNDPAELLDILSQPYKEVNHIFPVNENTLIVNWSFKDEAYTSLPTKLGDRVMYHDTDSAIYVSRPGDTYEVPIGSYLGEMTDELAEYGEGSYITDFVSGGPKLYVYRVYSTDKDKTIDIIKVKGITLNYSTHKQVNFDKLKDMVLNDATEEYVTTRNILRNTNHSVVTKEVTKVFRTTFTKRKRIENYDSVPYGYKRQCI